MQDGESLALTLNRVFRGFVQSALHRVMPIPPRCETRFRRNSPEIRATWHARTGIAGEIHNHGIDKSKHQDMGIAGNIAGWSKLHY
jgi:hypothetical protein